MRPYPITVISNPPPQIITGGYPAELYRYFKKGPSQVFCIFIKIINNMLGRICFKFKSINRFPLMFKIGSMYLVQATINSVIYIFFGINYLKFIPFLYPEKVYRPGINIR